MLNCFSSCVFRYRLRGNEYFRSKEFDNALLEYTRAIQICPEKAVAAYNNRALTCGYYFKIYLI